MQPGLFILIFNIIKLLTSFDGGKYCFNLFYGITCIHYKRNIRKLTLQSVHCLFIIYCHGMQYN